MKDQVKSYAKVQAQYWLDENFRQALKKDPADILRNGGIEIPKGTKVSLLENSDKVSYFLIPQMPKGMTGEEIARVEAGGTFGTAGSIGSAGSVCTCLGTFGTVGTFGCSSLREDGEDFKIDKEELKKL